MKKFIAIIYAIALTLLMSVGVKADTNYNLLYEWSRQPTNVQYALARDGVTIQVVPELEWTSNDLSETWAYTQVTTLPDTRTVTSCSIVLLDNYEYCLTHEIGHAISNYAKYRYFWTDNIYWDTIYQTEAHNQMIYPQGWQNKYEYFACCYDEYLTFPKYMKVLQPSSYNYMEVVMRYTQ